jgi:hypothetical protein
MKPLSLIFLYIFCLSTTSFGQYNKDCFEIKYLDFFEIEDMESFKWPEDELNGLLETDFTEDEREKNLRTNFLIPYIVFQLKDFHPACSNNPDTSTFRKLRELYFKIRQEDVSAISSMPVSKQLEMIREDFYSQVQDDSLLPFMEFTLDDGPFYGQLTEYIPDYSKGRSYKMEFGTLYITRDSGKVHLTVFSNENSHVWTRVMTGSGERFLSEVSFSENGISKTSLGYRLLMFSEGEALNLNLKSNGGFRYYFHSW